jgi:hypothetical protein
MRKNFLRYPWYYFLFSFYPLLFLWVANISQLDAGVLIRPSLYTLIGSAALFGLLYLIFKNKNKAAITGLILLIAFFSYGRIYYATRAIKALNILNHHSILIPIFIVLIGLSIWGALRLRKKSTFNLYANIIIFGLVLLQIVELSYSYIRSSLAHNQTIEISSGLTLPTDIKNMPDIYVFVLDAYMRSDALKQDLGYDNSEFIDQLNKMGFYVPECSQPNYTFTYASISSLYNMRYIPGAYENDIWSEFNDSGFWSIIKNNEVYAQLKEVGYKTVSFEEEYPMLQFNNSDVLIGASHPTVNSAYLYPFEVMYQKTTALIIINAIDPENKIGKLLQNIFNKNNQDRSEDLSALSGENKDFVVSHIKNTRFILDHIADVPAISGPKLAYIHLFIPHYPYVFGPNGEIFSDPGYYSGDRGGAINAEYEKKGYVNQIQYINKQLIPILQNVIDQSKNPPIIVIIGDHGLFGSNRMANLEAFYLPDNGNSKLYSTITPVNIFRIIFNEYFGGNYPLLPDETYVTDTDTVSDPFPNCTQ